MSVKPLVVLLGHKAHVGKDMLGEYLVKNHKFRRFGFADKLKSVVADLYDFNNDHMYGELKNVPDERYIKQNVTYAAEVRGDGFDLTLNNYLTPREILQDFGQEQRDRFPNIWADYVFRAIESNRMIRSDTAFSQRYVITDFRFPNEATVGHTYALENNWDLVTVKINRPDSERGDFAGSENISEIALDGYNFDLEIYNNKTPEVLFERFERFILNPRYSQVKEQPQTVKVDLSFMEK
jgi:hypothetical protein